jgi:hypothetical protein
MGEFVNEVLEGKIGLSTKSLTKNLVRLKSRGIIQKAGHQNMGEINLVEKERIEIQ